VLGKPKRRFKLPDRKVVPLRPLAKLKKVKFEDKSPPQDEKEALKSITRYFRGGDQLIEQWAVHFIVGAPSVKITLRAGKRFRVQYNPAAGMDEDSDEENVYDNDDELDYENEDYPHRKNHKKHKKNGNSDVSDYGSDKERADENPLMEDEYTCEVDERKEYDEMNDREEDKEDYEDYEDYEMEEFVLPEDREPFDELYDYEEEYDEEENYRSFEFAI